MKKLLEKRFPTIIGVVLLFLTLGAGVFFLETGPGIFTPRATPQTTPKSVKVTNTTDTTVTISFITDDVTVGFVKYGNSAKSLNIQSNDDRDQLSGKVNTYNTHHVTLRNLQPNTTYFFTLGTSASATFDNNGQPYVVKTAERAGTQSLAQTIYGTVLNQQSSAAEGSIVYVTVEGATELSTLVRSSGTWAIPLAQLRSTSGSKDPDVTSNTPMKIMVQGKTAADTASLTTNVGQPQFPVKTITLGQNSTEVASANPTASPATNPTAAPTTAASTGATPSSSPRPTATTAAGTTNQPVITASGSATPTLVASATATLKKSPTPKASPTPNDVSMPATDSPKPISGSGENTFMILVAGLLFIGFGSTLAFAVKKN